MDWRSALAVFSGGGLGALLRYGVTIGISQRMGPGFPWWTFVINVTGSFVIGVVAELTQTRSFAAAPFVRVFFMVGVIGGYTTFSTFSLDALNLINERAGFMALLYVIGSVVLGLAAAFCGVAMTRTLANV